MYLCGQCFCCKIIKGCYNFTLQPSVAVDNLIAERKLKTNSTKSFDAKKAVLYKKSYVVNIDCYEVKNQRHISRHLIESYELWCIILLLHALFLPS